MNCLPSQLWSTVATVQVILLREANRALAVDVSHLQYRLSEQHAAVEGSIGIIGEDEQDYLHRKLKEFSRETAKHVTALADMEEAQLLLKRQLKQVKRCSVK